MAHSMPDWLDAAARSSPRRTALSIGSRQWTYAELRRATVATAAYLSHKGASRDGRIGLLSANRPGYVFAVHAARRLGVEIVPLNWRLTAPELACQIRAANIRLLLVDEPRGSVASDASNGLPVPLLPIEELEAASDRSEQRDRDAVVDLSCPAAVLFTSGTSGTPKGAQLTYGNFWFSAIGSTLRLGHRQHDAWLATMPLFHIGGLSILIRACIGAVPVVLHDGFDPDAVVSSISAGATHVSLVPAMLARLLEVRDVSWATNLRVLLVGGSSAPGALIESSLRLGLPVAPTYGLTEAASQVTTLLPGEVADRRCSSGLPLPTTDLRVVTPQGEAAPGQAGEIEVRGPTLFAGYIGDGVRIQPAGAWFSTGDLGYLDVDGYLYVVDRRHDLIVSGGENIYPAEIERALGEHPSVVDVGVVSLRDNQWGARPAAAVVWQGDSAAAESQLRAHLRARLAAFKIPERIVIVESLPRTASGKLLRDALRDQIVSGPSDP
jgi:o-succinylbenzoate---CoA ligase